MLLGRVQYLSAIVLFCLPLLSGCAESAAKGTVSGKVIYNGKPVPEGCLVTFLSNVGYAALGTTNAAGEYTLVMAGSPDVPVANYNVSVTYPAYQGSEMTEEEERLFNSGDPATVAKFSQKASKSPIPERYADPFISGLSFAIQKGSNTYDIDLQ